MRRLKHWLTLLGLVLFAIAFGITAHYWPIVFMPKRVETIAAVLPYQVTVYQALPAEVPLEKDGRLHLFCNAKSGYLVIIFDDKIAVDRGGCK